ncbi:MAG: hypothetical protein JSS65_14635 [Armatimonadetes bacterium]|nr:hypothetical protein [Armatimonadota bacterium]
MVIGVILLAAQSNTVAETLQRIVTTHEALPAAAFSAVGRTSVGGNVQVTRYEVRYTKQGPFTLRQVVDGSPDPVRVIALDGKTLTMFDPKTKQYARRMFSAQPEVKDAIATSGLTVDPFIVSLITSGGMAEFTKQFQKLDDWTYKPDGGKWKLVLNSKAGSATLDLDAKSGLLTGLHANVDGQTLDWTVTYSQAKSGAFTPPSDAFEVAEIDPSFRNPSYASSEAKAVAEKMFKAYDRPKSMGVEVSNSDSKYKLWYRPGTVRQSDGKSDWSFSQGQLTVVTRGTTYAGKSSLRETVDRLPAAKSRVEPLARAFLKGRNYFRTVLSNGDRVSVAGKTKIEGASCTILSTKGGMVNYSIIVRDSDGLVVSLGASAQGAVSETSFRYMPASAGDLRPSGVSSNPRPISDLK